MEGEEGDESMKGWPKILFKKLFVVLPKLSKLAKI